jgi:HSP20 family molecular chaperone IbpA
MKRPAKSAAKLFVLENNDPISAETEAIQSRIRQRAFEISQTRPPDAHEIYDWIVAESEIISVPPAELIETDAKFEVKFAVAGVAADDVNVMVTPDQVLLKCEYNHQHDSGVGTVHLCDFNSATVFRSVNLPHPIDVNTVKLNFAAGVVLVSALKHGGDDTGRKRMGSVRKAPAKKSRPRLS